MAGEGGCGSQVATSHLGEGVEPVVPGGHQRAQRNAGGDRRHPLELRLPSLVPARRAHAGVGMIGRQVAVAPITARRRAQSTSNPGP